MAHIRHRELSKRKLSFFIVTVSTSRYRKKRNSEKYTDESGDIAEKVVKAKGHNVERRTLISDDELQIKETLDSFLKSNGDVIVFTGGTGVSSRDLTVETVRQFFEKELEGYGELIRMLSYRKIGTAAILTRATAGIAKGKLIVCLPGSPDGVKLALEKTISEFPHIVFIARS
jgi:molybdenum cofactor biosynthesis protein B